MTKLSTTVTACAVALLAGALTVAPDAAGATDGGEALADVREATARYHELDAALNDGYVSFDLCVDQMGEHYGRPDSIGDGRLDAAEPEGLVYAHVGDRLQLVAVEYVSTEPGDVLGIPLHFNAELGVWVLHAWVWKHNPAGVHTDLNPRISNCP